MAVSDIVYTFFFFAVSVRRSIFQYKRFIFVIKPQNGRRTNAFGYATSVSEEQSVFIRITFLKYFANPSVLMWSSSPIHRFMISKHTTSVFLNIYTNATHYLYVSYFVTRRSRTKQK